MTQCPRKAEAHLHHHPRGHHPRSVPVPGPHPLPRVGAFPVPCAVTRGPRSALCHGSCHGCRMAQTVDFRGIPICRAGEWNGLTGKAVVTPDDLQAVVAAYQDGEVDKARVKLGHVSELNALGDGAPAFGWVENPRLAADGRTLLGDLVDVPRRLGEVVGRGYRNVSVELRKNVRTPSGKTHPTVLSGLALLGAAAPAVKGLDDLVALYASEPIPDAPTDGCEDGAVVTISLGDALDPVTHADIPVPSPVTCDGEPDSPDRPGREKEGEPSMAFLDQAREKFGLPADASEDQLLERITALSESPADPDTTVKAEETDVTGDPDVTEPELKSETVDAPETVTVSKAQWDELTAQVSELAAERKAKHQEQVIESALSEGRIAPAEREKWTTALSAAPEATETLLSSLAPRVNVREQGSDVALSASTTDDDAAFKAWADKTGF